MTDLGWERNSKYQNLPHIDVGDIVHLKFTNTFDFLIKGIVTKTDSPKISAKVEAVFDWHGAGQIVSGEITSLVNEPITFERCMVHEVIKREKVR